MIVRRYETKEDCARLWLDEAFRAISLDMVVNQVDFSEDWEFCGLDDEGYGPVDAPIWGTVWEVEDTFDNEWFERHKQEVAELGFTVIEHDGEFWGVGIDAAGIDFFEAFWIPLYDVRGLEWHQEM